MKIIINVLYVLLMVVVVSGCELTGAYNEMKGVNDDSFSVAMMRVCGPTAFLAASRQLSLEEQNHRTALCLKYDARTMSEFEAEQSKD